MGHGQRQRTAALPRAALSSASPSARTGTPRRRRQLRRGRPVGYANEERTAALFADSGFDTVAFSPNGQTLAVGTTTATSACGRRLAVGDLPLCIGEHGRKRRLQPERPDLAGADDEVTSDYGTRSAKGGSPPCPRAPGQQCRLQPERPHARRRDDGGDVGLWDMASESGSPLCLRAPGQ